MLKTHIFKPESQSERSRKSRTCADKLFTIISYRISACGFIFVPISRWVFSEIAYFEKSRAPQKQENALRIFPGKIFFNNSERKLLLGQRFIADKKLCKIFQPLGGVILYGVKFTVLRSSKKVFLAFTRIKAFFSARTARDAGIFQTNQISLLCSFSKNGKPNGSLIKLVSTFNYHPKRVNRRRPVLEMPTARQKWIFLYTSAFSKFAFISFPFINKNNSRIFPAPDGFHGVSSPVININPLFGFRGLFLIVACRLLFWHPIQFIFSRFCPETRRKQHHPEHRNTLPSSRLTMTVFSDSNTGQDYRVGANPRAIVDFNRLLLSGMPLKEARCLVPNR